MAKAKTTTKAPKATKAKAPAADTTNAAVGPVAGTLEGQPDAIKTTEAPAKVGKTSKKSQALVAQSIEEQFAAIQKTLEGTNSDKKQPRQLRWALRALEAAKDAALRHVQHNV